MREDLTGRKFGRLVVVEARKHDIQGAQVWWCRCDCGQELPVPGYALLNDNTKSCGCLKRERATEYFQRSTYRIPTRISAADGLKSHCNSAHAGALDPNCTACKELQQKAGQDGTR